MKRIFYCCLFLSLYGCTTNDKPIQEKRSSPTIKGTWKLLQGVVIKGEDTVVTDYTHQQEVIKLINESHFAFLRHDLHHGKDSNAVFVSGGGKCEITSNTYIEHLDYCNYRTWENNTFEFNYTIVGDTLTTTGIEKVEALNVNQVNTEKYIRIK